LPQERSIAKVIVDLPVREVDRIFDYEIPAVTEGDVAMHFMHSLRKYTMHSNVLVVC